MSFWAIEDSLIDENRYIELISSRRVHIRDGDKLILFKRRYDDVIFTGYGEITSSELIVKEVEGGFIFRAHLNKTEAFKEVRYLEDFNFSLEKIYRFADPKVHFRRNYTRLSAYDYNTVIKANIFWARTAFGLFINELQRELLVRFLGNIAESNPDILLQRGDYITAWKLLRAFIEDDLYPRQS